ncbi:hypothetical protein [Streptomyces alboniger]|uniref:Uncharacterized protein n=1 Tax=Streptomyces alboniger TaxID=132473 RepID=A0A5J6HP41_STRAD|nr:hypothetical protein [Streptomyces alboniger]QEV21248.1 hypothetical protein CP975_30225 [Streptomyces alboniger]
MTAGRVAAARARGHHLAVMPGDRVRGAADWLLEAAPPRRDARVGRVRLGDARLGDPRPSPVRSSPLPADTKTARTPRTSAPTGPAAPKTARTPVPDRDPQGRHAQAAPHSKETPS